MSRSTKKPYFTDQQNSRGARGATKHFKNKANNKVKSTKTEDTPANGGAYKKEYESYKIRDWSFHDPKSKKAHRK